MTRWQRLRLWLTPHRRSRYFADATSFGYWDPGCVPGSCVPDCRHEVYRRRVDFPTMRVRSLPASIAAMRRVYVIDGLTCPDGGVHMFGVECHGCEDNVRPALTPEDMRLPRYPRVHEDPCASCGRRDHCRHRCADPTWHSCDEEMRAEEDTEHRRTCAGGDYAACDHPSHRRHVV